MKKKEITKKLVLNKETIVDLNKRDMKDIHGGVRHTEFNTLCSCAPDGGDCIFTGSMIIRVCCI